MLEELSRPRPSAARVIRTDVQLVAPDLVGDNGFLNPGPCDVLCAFDAVCGTEDVSREESDFTSQLLAWLPACRTGGDDAMRATCPGPVGTKHELPRTRAGTND